MRLHLLTAFLIRSTGGLGAYPGSTAKPGVPPAWGALSLQELHNHMRKGKSPEEGLTLESEHANSIQTALGGFETLILNSSLFSIFFNQYYRYYECFAREMTAVQAEPPRQVGPQTDTKGRP